MGYAGFQHTTAVYAERYFSFLRSQYAVVDPGWFRSGYHSSETLLAFAARWLHLAFARDALFDLRLLGGIHALLFLLALAGLIRACRDLAPTAQALVAALLVFVFTDVGYVAPFNSFYSQTASLLFLLLTAAIAAEAVRRGRLSGPWLFAYFGTALLFVGSKPQERARGAGSGPLRPAPGGGDLAGSVAADGRRTRHRSLSVLDLVRAPHAPHAARSDALPVRLRRPARLLARAGRRRRRASPRSRVAEVCRIQSLRDGFAPPRVAIPDVLPSPGRPSADPGVLPAAPETIRGARREGFAPGLVAAADLRQLRGVGRISARDAGHEVFAVEPGARAPGSASAPRDRGSSRRKPGCRGGDLAARVAPGPALSGRGPD